MSDRRTITIIPDPHFSTRFRLMHDGKQYEVHDRGLLDLIFGPFAPGESFHVWKMQESQAVVELRAAYGEAQRAATSAAGDANTARYRAAELRKQLRKAAKAPICVEHQFSYGRRLVVFGTEIELDSIQRIAADAICKDSPAGEVSYWYPDLTYDEITEALAFAKEDARCFWGEKFLPG